MTDEEREVRRQIRIDRQEAIEQIVYYEEQLIEIEEKTNYFKRQLEFWNNKLNGFIKTLKMLNEQEKSK